jgi:hypothetical protein
MNVLLFNWLLVHRSVTGGADNSEFAGEWRWRAKRFIRREKIFSSWLQQPQSG